MKCSVLTLRVDPKEIHFIRFIMEACDSLAVVKTRDPKTGVIDVLVPPGREPEAEGVLNSLADQGLFMDRMK